MSHPATESAPTAPRVGVIGADIPRQLILAAAATPVRLPGAWSGEASREASELLGAADAVAVRVLDGVLAGRHDDLAGLVVCNDSMAHLRVFYVLRVLSSRGRLPFPVHLLDTPRGGGSHRTRFVARQYERLSDFASEVTGHPFDTADLVEAGARETRLRRALERVRTQRRKRELAGADSLRCYSAAAQRTPEEALAEIEAILNVMTSPDAPSARPHNGLKNAVPVFMTGSSHPDPTVYEALEQAGCLVVGEDHDIGDAAWIGDPVDASETTVFQKLAERHAQRPPAAARSLSSERSRHLLEAVKQSGAVGVMAFIRDLDDGPVWDLPAQREMLAVRGRRWLGAVVQVPADDTEGATNTLIAQFQAQVATP